MKRVATFTMALMFLFLIVGLVGCGDGSDEGSNPPSIMYSYPKNGSSLISTTASIMLTFDKDIAPPSASNIILTPGASGSISYDGESKTVTFKPNSPLSANTPYTLKVEGVKSLDGGTISPVTISFTTLTSDVSSPKIASTVPEDGLRDIGPNDDIIIRFTEPINRVKFVNGIRFAPSVDLKGGESVWRFLWSINDEREVSIIPPPGNSALKLDTEYSLILPRDAIEDMSGNKMVTDYTLTFKTLRYAPEPITSTDLNTPSFVSLKEPPWLYSVGKYGPNSWIVVWGGTPPPGGSGSPSGSITASGDGEILEGSVKWTTSYGGEKITTNVSSGKGNNLSYSGPAPDGQKCYRLMFACTSSYVTFSLGATSQYINIGQKGVRPSRTPFVLNNR